jgi:hypothetical protein
LAHVTKFGDTDLFPVPFEFEAIRGDWTVLKKELGTANLDEYRSRPFQQVLMPKSRIGFRVSTQLDPLDSLIYASILYEFADEIEKYRVPSKLDIVCSYRLKVQADGALFEHETGWPTFHARSVHLSNSGRFTHVLIADIADFYNQVSHHRVNNVLQSAGVPTDRAKNVERFLSTLSAKQSRGLPVGPSASIALAEAALDDVDKYLLSRGLEYVRYVDDFRIFCQSEKQAIDAAHDLTQYLYTAHRLALASSKTVLYTVKRFIDRELLDPHEEEERGKVSKLKQLIQEVLDNTGYQIDFDELPESDLNDVTRDNLAELFLEAAAKKPLHLGLTRYLLRRAKQLKTSVLRKPVLENLSALTPAMREVIEYLVVAVKPATMKETGDALIAFTTEAPSGPLPFVRMWVLEFFIRRPKSAEYLDTLRIATESRDSLGVRPTALLAKAYKQVQWVRSQKEKWANHAPWDRRAIVWAASVLPEDERRHWCGLVRETASDPLDRAVAILSAQG